jgi:hypothetical protein
MLEDEPNRGGICIDTRLSLKIPKSILKTAREQSDTLAQQLCVRPVRETRTGCRKYRIAEYLMRRTVRCRDARLPVRIFPCFCSRAQLES